MGDIKIKFFRKVPKIFFIFFPSMDQDEYVKVKESLINMLA